MRKLLIGIAALGLAATGAWAHGNDKSADTTKSDTSKSDTMNKSASNEVTGQVSKIDKSARSLTLSLPSGETRDLKLATDAKVTRDGSTIGLDQLKEGDNVRASFDPSSNEAKSIDVTSKSDTSKSGSDMNKKY